MSRRGLRAHARPLLIAMLSAAAIVGPDVHLQSRQPDVEKRLRRRRACRCRRLRGTSCLGTADAPATTQSVPVTPLALRFRDGGLCSMFPGETMAVQFAAASMAKRRPADFGRNAIVCHLPRAASSNPADAAISHDPDDANIAGRPSGKRALRTQRRQTAVGYLVDFVRPSSSRPVPEHGARSSSRTCRKRSKLRRYRGRTLRWRVYAQHYARNMSAHARKCAGNENWPNALRADRAQEFPHFFRRSRNFDLRMSVSEKTPRWAEPGMEQLQTIFPTRVLHYIVADHDRTNRSRSAGAPPPSCPSARAARSSSRATGR